MRYRLVWLGGATALIAGALACGGLGGQSSVDEAMQTIAPTEARGGGAMVMSLDGAAPPTMASGDGLQVLQVAPTGTGRKSLQAAVVFDRAMVALTDLDSMTQSAPLSCTPEVPARLRWAGTSTAVLIPDEGSFPLATRFTCSVPSGLTSLDGTRLENTIQWDFETDRPKVQKASATTGATPDDPIDLTFSQPVDPAVVGPKISLTEGSTRVEVAVEAIPDEPTKLRVVPSGMKRDTGYVLTVDAGFVSTLGPLGSGQPYTKSFRTYPPLSVKSFKPLGTPKPTTSVRFEFTTRVMQEVLAKHLTIDPPPIDEWDPPSGSYESTYYSYYLKLQPRTAYTLSIAEGVTDVYGQALPAQEHRFTTGDYDPWLDVATGFNIYAANNPKNLPIRHLNTEYIDLHMATVSLEQLRQAEGFFADAHAAAMRSGRAVPIRGDGELNKTAVKSMDLQPYLADGHGMVAWTLSSPEVLNYRKEPRQYEGAALVTDLGTTLKVSPGAMEAWVTRLSDGRPVDGAEVVFYSGKTQVAAGTTDARGFVRVTGQPTSGWKPYDDPIWAVARSGKDWSVVRHGDNDDFGPWQFQIWPMWNGAGQRLVHHAFADRGVYKLGDPAYVRMTYRYQTAAGLETPSGQASWELHSPDGDTVAKGQGPLDDRGGINVEVTLPEEGRLGDYYLRFRFDDQGTRTVELPARAYRAPSFRVSVAAPTEVFAGDAVQAAVDARYLFGAPMDDVEVFWRTWHMPDHFAPDGWDGFSFGPEYRWWEEDADHRGGANDYGSGEGSVDAGAFGFEVEATPSDDLRARTLNIEARVTGKDRQSITSSHRVTVHPAAWYAGVRPTERLPAAGEETSAFIAAVNPDGSPRSESVEVKVVRRTWDRVRQKGMDGRWEYVNTPVDEAVHTETVTTHGDGVETAFTPEDPGYYVISASGTDDQGRKTLATDSLYVTGSGYTPWGLSDDRRIGLVPDKQTYNPGDTAEILVQTPREGLHALVTVEREGVLWRDIVELKGTASTVRFPIEESYKPNVYVSVMAVEGAGPQLSPDAGKPQVLVGMLEVPVDASDEHLDVAITTDEDDYRPRDTVTATVKVEREGEAVPNAGVTLFAVDEAVLMLTAYTTPDAHSAMYIDHRLMVKTGDTRVNILDRANYLTKGAPPGGGGGMQHGPEIRTDFVTTPTWQPDLRTGPDGTVEASFDLPDNLTAFRIMAVVDTEASFGSAKKEIRVNRPIVVKPALPRFLRVQDQAFAGVVVHNQTGEQRDIEVTGSVTGPVEIVDEQTRTVRMEAGQAREVAFQLRGLEPGSATFTFEASSGADRDALEWSIPIQREHTLDVAATAGTTTDTLQEQIARPDNAYASVGSLDVDLATTVLVGAGSALDYVVDYPHGCVEQVTSRGMASLAALEIRQAAGIEATEPELRANVEEALAKLPRFRHHMQGLSYWPGASHVSVMGTAYAVEFMGRASEAGFAVPDNLLSPSVAFLRDVQAGKHLGRYDPIVALSGRAYITVALARAGHGDAGHNSQLYAQRRDLSILGTASLLEAIARTTGPDGRTAELTQTILSRAFIEPASASIKENETGTWSSLWGSDDLSTAAALEALVVAGGEHVLAPKLANHLAGSRVQGRWHNTRATAGVMAALGAYSRRYEDKGQPVDMRVTQAGQELFAGTKNIGESAAIHIPMADLKNGMLELNAKGGRLYYEARLAYSPRVVEPRDEGFTVVRHIEIVEGDGDTIIEGGELLRISVQVVTPVVRHDVAIVDPLPAGLEAVQSSFATTSKAPRAAPKDGTPELSEYGGSWVFDHSELRDDEVRLYADYMPPGIHTYRYVARATTPGTYTHPPATAEEMYEPENFGRTGAEVFTVSAGAEVAAQ